MDIDNHSLDHDELLGVEAIEDIIDVENEMGFGEGEDWSHADDSTVGYGKLAASRRRALYKGSAVHLRPRGSPVGVRSHRPRKPIAVVRQGSKHGVSSSSDGDEKPTKVCVSIRPSIKHSSFSSGDGADKKGEALENAHYRPRMLSGDEDDTDHSLRSSQDEDSMCVDLNSRNGDMQASKQDGIKRDKDDETCIKQAEDESGKTVAHKDAKRGYGKPEEKTNRVRFSLDFETADKGMGLGNKRGSDGKEKAKGAKQQEWRYVRTMPNDSNGFGAPKACVGPPARSMSAQRRKEPASAESVKDLRVKDPTVGFDLEKAIEMRDDRKAARLAQERIERFEDAMVKQQEIVATMRVLLTNEGVKDHATKLRQLIDALDRNIKKVSASSKVRQVPPSYELKNRAEQINKLKVQCNLLETDRERLKKKLHHLLEKGVGGNEREENTQTKERERDVSQENGLEQKVRGLEESLAEWEAKFKKVEADCAMEKALLEDNLSVCKLDWRNKQQRWVSKMKEREAELAQMKSSQNKLLDSLVSCRQCMDTLRNEAAACNGNFALHGENRPSEEQNTYAEEMNALNLAYSIQHDMESFRRLLAESSIALQHHPKLEPEALRQESKALENKVAHTISMMTELKKEMKVQEDRIKKENENYAQAVAEKMQHVEALEEQLADKEHDMKSLVHELNNEVSCLNKELERERSERVRLSDVQGTLKYKLLKGLRKKEQKMEEEMEVLKEKMEEMRASIAEKDEKIALLEKEVEAKCVQLVQEKQKWNMAIKEVKQKAAKTILRFMRGKENGLLEHLRERRKSHKGHTGYACKGDDPDEEEHECLSNRSAKEKLHAKRHYTRETFGDSGPQEALSNFKGNLSVHDEDDDLRSSFESYKGRAKQDQSSFGRREDHALQDLYPKSSTKKKRDGSDRRKRSVDNTLGILQGSMHDIP